MPENDACLHQKIRDLLAALPARFRRGLPGLELAHRQLLPFSSFRRDDYLPVHSQGPEPDRIHGRKLTIQQPGGLERSDHVKRSRRHDPQAIPPQQHKAYAPLFRIGPVARASWVACLKRLGESLNRCDSVGKLCLSATVISDLGLLVAGCGTSTVECVFESSLTAPSNQCLDVLSTQQDSRGLRTQAHAGGGNPRLGRVQLEREGCCEWLCCFCLMPAAWDSLFDGARQRTSAISATGCAFPKTNGATLALWDLASGRYIQGSLRP